MRRRKENKLMNLAFGELSKDEAAALEGSLSDDPQARNTVQSYQRMRSDLQLLHDIPEMQMSHERLRDAVLREGLKKQNHAARFGWVVAPGMAVVLAVALMMGRSQLSVNAPETVAPGMTLGDVVAAKVSSLGNPLSEKPELTNLDHLVRKDYSFGKPDSAPKGAKGAGGAPAVAPSRTPVHFVRSFASEAPQPVSENTLSEPAASEPSTNNLAETQPASDDVAMMTPQNDDKIVIVDQAKDSQTGAQRATEVGSAADVVVGG